MSNADNKNLDHLISKLSGEGPRKPLAAPAIRILPWLGVALAYLLIASVMKGFRYDLDDKLVNPFFWTEIALLAATGISAAFAAAYLSEPDVHGKPNMRFLPLFFFIPLTAYIVFQQWMPEFTGANLMHAINHAAWHCAGFIFVFSVPPGVLLFWMMRKAATVRVYWAAGMATLSVTSFAYLVMRFVEPTDDAMHLLLWHALPALLVALTGIALGRLALRW